MSLAKQYQAQDHEADIYQRWEEAGCFRPKLKPAKDSFSILLPPPNANANLHTGQALDFQLKDIIGRWQRMQGKQVMIMPGADHAGFETWVVYEKILNEQGKSRFDFSRQELYQQVWDFVASNKQNMMGQIRRLGISCDWQRFTFSLDDKVVQHTYAVFERLWNDGLIYRGKRLVNYCSHHGTAFSDIEVEHRPIEGHLWQIAYPLSDGSGKIEIATTRPETLLADVAIAVHPKDPRYKQHHNQTVKLPLTDRQIPIIQDLRVDRKFGTGAVKITPAHDFNDYAIAKDHDLPMIEAINKQGKITDDMPKTYRGLSVKQARQAVLKDLEAAGYLVKQLDYNYSLSCCYKCQTAIEPLLSEQWFVKVQPLAKEAIGRLEAAEIDCYPAKKIVEIISYLKQLEDWNISRQIAWGISIPVFENTNKPGDWIVDQRVDQETIEVDGQTYRHDPDVFDTWWSSGQWPYATLGYLNDDADAKQFYPNDLMETGSDLLRQWVSRMIMLAVYTTGQVPFKQLYFHGMVLDKHGAKMSKSKGNVINPMDIVDQYGSDALRLGLVAGTSAGNPQHLDIAKIVSGRNFCNKLWNVARYVLGLLEDQPETGDAEAKTAADHWIIKQQANTIKQVNKLLTGYRLGLAYQQVYDFIWHDLADWYLEASKLSPNPGLMVKILKDSLRIVHPFAPFVSEAIWQYLPASDKATMLISQASAEAADYDANQAKLFTEVKAIVSQIRELKPAGKTDTILNHLDNQLVIEQAELISHLSGVKTIENGKPAQATAKKLPQAQIWLVSSGQDQAKPSRGLEEQQQLVERLKQRLANPDYLKKAPSQVVDQTRRQLKEAQKQLDSQ